MPDLNLEPLVYDPSGVIAVGGRLFECQLDKVLGALDRCRSESLADVEIRKVAAHSPPTRLPLDSAFIDLPERLLAEYHKHRSTSEVQRILDAARRQQVLVLDAWPRTRTSRRTRTNIWLWPQAALLC